MANPISNLLQKLGLKKSPESAVPPQPDASEFGQSAKAPNVEGMVWKNTSFAGAPNVGPDGTVVSKTEAVPIAPVTAEAAMPANPGGEMKG